MSIDIYLEEDPKENFITIISNESIEDISLMLRSSLKLGNCILILRNIHDMPAKLDVKARKIIALEYIFLSVAFKNSLSDFRISNAHQLFDSLKTYLN